mmetsp:Transcript_2674/g.2442  ORF Transcript_2674/g.2442 Transcript_2674/m.2442 type:complete len:139 (+) Transcript_2674:15-431(+)
MKTRAAVLTKKYSDSDFDESDPEYSTPKEKKFFCAICGLSYKSSSSLAIHMSCHKGEDTYKCQKSGCNAKFKSKAQLAAHQRNHLALASLFSPNHIEIFKLTDMLNMHRSFFENKAGVIIPSPSNHTQVSLPPLIKSE